MGMQSRAPILLRAKSWPFTAECPFLYRIKSMPYYCFCKSVSKVRIVPKAEELVSDPFRHGGKDQARTFFEQGTSRVFAHMREASDVQFPTTIYYAFKQAEDDEADASEDARVSSVSTGWETFLQGLVVTGWQIEGTWPMRTELGNRMRSMDSNALASSIVLVCRPRPADAPLATRREFLAALKRELPEALRLLQHGNIAPVDLAQAALALAWPSSRATPRSWRLVVPPCGCAQPWPSSIRLWTRSWRSKRANSTPTPVGAGLVRAVRPGGSTVRRGRNALQGQEHVGTRARGRGYP